MDFGNIVYDKAGRGWRDGQMVIDAHGNMLDLDVGDGDDEVGEIGI